MEGIKLLTTSLQGIFCSSRIFERNYRPRSTFRGISSRQGVCNILARNVTSQSRVANSGCVKCEIFEKNFALNFPLNSLNAVLTTPAKNFSPNFFRSFANIALLFSLTQLLASVYRRYNWRFQYSGYSQ